MTEVRARARARVLQSLAKLPQLSYRAVRTGETTWGIGQFYEEEQVAVVH